MSDRPRRLALAVAFFLCAAARAQQPGLKLERPVAGPARVDESSLPVFISADRLEGVSGQESIAEGNAELRRGSTAIFGEWLKYDERTEDVEARGAVRIERAGDVISGPSLKYNVKDKTGEFERPDFTLAPRARAGERPVIGRGHAERALAEGEDRYRLFETTFTTCKPGNEDWHLRVGELELDYGRQVGTARDASVYFKDLPILRTPYLDFALNNQRKSGILPPSIGSTGKSGAEITLPYYFNLAPNRDFTFYPRYLARRGLQLGGELRYLEPHYYGLAKLETLPNDRAADRGRSALLLSHNYNHDNRWLGNVNINKVSDDNYFRDLTSRLSLVAQTNLPREGQLIYNGTWWDGGAWTAISRAQRFQTLQDPVRTVAVPYGRAPQFTLTATKQDLRGLDFGFNGELVDFLHPTSVIGTRMTLYPSLALPLIAPGAFLTPKVGLHSTHYYLDRTGGLVPQRASRSLPIATVDGGLTFERDTGFFGRGYVQTLEPRAYYVYAPHRDQNQLPLFDTAVADFNYAQIFSENSFVGGDRINDANQVTLAMTSRLLFSETGQEAVRATVGQRYYFRNQTVTLDAAAPPRTYRSSDWIAALGGRVAPRWTVESGLQFNSREERTERVTVAARYQPEVLKTLNLSYRFLRDQVRQVDVSSQWPLGGGWYGVGRFNYSLRDGRVIEGLAGFEYNGECWIGRVVVQRFASAAGSATNALFLQLELNGFSRIGSNPLEALKRNIPGYARINQAVPAREPYGFEDY